MRAYLRVLGKASHPFLPRVARRRFAWGENFFFESFPFLLALSSAFGSFFFSLFECLFAKLRKGLLLPEQRGLGAAASCAGAAAVQPAAQPAVQPAAGESGRL